MRVIIKVVLKPLHHGVPELLQHPTELLVSPVQLPRLHPPKAVIHPHHHPRLHTHLQVHHSRVQDAQHLSLTVPTSFDFTLAVGEAEELFEETEEDVTGVAVM